LRWLLKRQALESCLLVKNWRGDMHVAGKHCSSAANKAWATPCNLSAIFPLLSGARRRRLFCGVQPSLKPLLSSLPNLTLVTTEDETLPPFDHYCLLLSLPGWPSAPSLNNDSGGCALPSVPGRKNRHLAEPIEPVLQAKNRRGLLRQPAAPK